MLLAYAPTEWLHAHWNRVRFEARTPKSLRTCEELERELVAVRANSYALVDEEVELGLRTIAVPIRNTRGMVVAALNIAVGGGRIAVADMAPTLLPLMASAQKPSGKFPDQVRSATVASADLTCGLALSALDNDHVLGRPAQRRSHRASPSAGRERKLLRQPQFVRQLAQVG